MARTSYMPASGVATGERAVAAPAAARRTPWRERLGAWARPPRRLRVTREGWIFILVTVGLGTAAVNTGNNLLFLVLGLMLGLIIVSGLMSEATLRGLEIQRHVPRRVHAGAPTLVEVTLRNRKRLLPSYSVELEDLVEGWSTDKRCYFLKVGPSGSQTATYRTTFPRRGALHFKGYRVATRYPFGLFEKWREVDLAETVVVFPRIVRVPRGLSGRVRGGERSRRRPGAGEETHGLRELRPGDDFRSIHWRTSARRGRLMVRETEEEAALRLAISLDNARSPDRPAEGEDPVVERAISIAASLALDRAARGQAVALAIRGGLGPSVEPGGRPDRLLAFLGLLGYADRDDPPPMARLPAGEALLVSHPARAGGFDGAVIPVEVAGEEAP